MSILEMSLHASAVILFAALLRALALRRLPKRCFVALWLLAAARMLLPWKLPFRYGALALLAHAFPALGADTALPARSTALFARTGAALVKGTAAVNPGAVMESGATTTSALISSISPWRVLWLAGLIACALALLLPHLRWRRVYARSLPVEDVNVDSWLLTHPLWLRKVRVRISDEIPTPLTYGLLRPVILLPTSLDRENLSQLHSVLIHELTHIRRFDLLAKLIFAAALCVHWFNPLAWLMYLLANRDIELSCDEAVLRGKDASVRRRYAHTLLDLAAQQRGLPSPLFNGFGRQTIEERISTIMNGRQVSKIATLIAILLIVFATLGLATSAEEAEPANPQIEELMFDGWEDLTLLNYRERVYALNPAPDSLKRQENYNDPRYSDFLRFVLEPLTEGEWRGVALDWTQEAEVSALSFVREESIGGTDMDSGESGGFDLRVRCDVPDADALRVGAFRDALRAVLDGMDAISPIDITQDALDERARELAAMYSSDAVEFQIEATVQDATYSSDATEFQTDATVKESWSSQEEVAGALFFNGWEKTNVRDYAAIIAESSELIPAEANDLPDNYMKYIYYPLRAGFDMP